MNATTTAAMERLQSILDAPVRQRAPELRELAEHRAEHGRRADVIVKQVAVAEAPAVEADTTSGTFTALVSDYQTDREGDRFMPGAWDKAIAQIRKAGRPIPLLFGHDTRTIGAVIGLVQPADVWADERGLWIKGWLDTGDTLGQRLYRMVQKGVLTWSVGFSLARNQRGQDGVNELVEVRELYEVSATPLPANPRTATAGMKSADREPPSLDELRRLEAELGLNENERRRQQTADELVALMRTAMGHTNGDSAKALRARADRVAREFGPIQIASFDA
jgi:HK97 family phage prohead protease